MTDRSDTQTERVDFSGNAPVYDRRHGVFAPERIVSQLIEVTGLPLGSRILDVGAGTGRAAIRQSFNKLQHRH
jgi:ubiquinone/menaquinone biosynthesis C-methylase UbiE